MAVEIQIPIDDSVKVFVNVGDKIVKGTVYAQKLLSVKGEIIPIAKLLGVTSASISQYLCKFLGEEIKVGEILAKHKSFLSQVVVKSPICGVVNSIDSTGGTVTVVEKNSEKVKRFALPIDGVLTLKNPTRLTISLNASSFTGTHGNGDDQLGTFRYISSAEIHSLSVPERVEGCIIGCRKIFDDAIAKLEAIGVSGIVTTAGIKEYDTPTLVVSEEVFTQLVHCDGNTVWLRPKALQFIYWKKSN